MCQSLWDGMQSLCSFSSLAPPGLLGASASDSSKTVGGAGAEQGGLNLTGSPSVLAPSPFSLSLSLRQQTLAVAQLCFLLSSVLGLPCGPLRAWFSAPIHGAPCTSHRTHDSRPLPPPAQHPSLGRAPLSIQHLCVSWTSPSCVLLAQPR